MLYKSLRTRCIFDVNNTFSRHIYNICNFKRLQKFSFLSIKGKIKINFISDNESKRCIDNYIKVFLITGATNYQRLFSYNSNTFNDIP